MAGSAAPEFLYEAAVFLGAATVAVPLFTRLKLGAVLGYLVAGVAIGPAVLGLVADPKTVFTISEFGIVLLLFVIGLELAPSRLWALRRAILGLGFLQVTITAVLLSVIAALALGYSWVTAGVLGTALALSSTAFALQVLKERGALNTPRGQTALSILLFQDLAIIPILAILALLAPTGSGAGFNDGSQLLITLAAVGGVVVVGRYALTPVFRFIARWGAREVFIGAALLVVVSAALVMAYFGLSMALGAFLAGVALAESEFRHELEADIEPFRGLMLGLFFIAVGLGIDLDVIRREWLFLLIAAPVLMLLKAAVIYVLVRLFGDGRSDSREIAAVLPQAGEFGFVLFATATAGGVLSSSDASLFTALVALTMALTPLFVMTMDALGPRLREVEAVDDLEAPVHTQPSVIVAGFGRVGQIVSQMLIARGLKVTMVDTQPTRIRAAREFGARVYFGNGLRVDVLRAAGAEDAQMLIMCTDRDEVTRDSINAVRRAFPHLVMLVRAHDRQHMMELRGANYDYAIRETFESSIVLAREALGRLGVAEDTVDSIEEEFRRRDADRLAIQMETNDIRAGREMAYRQVAPFDIGPTEQADGDAENLAAKG